MSSVRLAAWRINVNDRQEDFVTESWDMVKVLAAFIEDFEKQNPTKACRVERIQQVNSVRLLPIKGE